MYSVRKKRRDLINKVEVGKRSLNDSGISFDVFTVIPDELKLSKEHIGKRVWIAEDTRTTQCFLRKFHDVGEKGWPEGGYEVQLKGTKYYRSFFLDEAILHPKEIKLSKKLRQKNKAIKEAKKRKYKNPITGRMCSYKYSLDNGIINEVGEGVPLKDMKFENPDTGRMVSYSYAKQKGII